MRNVLCGINSRFDSAEEKIGGESVYTSNLNRSYANCSTEEEIWRNEQSFSDDRTKFCRILIPSSLYVSIGSRRHFVGGLEETQSRDRSAFTHQGPVRASSARCHAHTLSPICQPTLAAREARLCWALSSRSSYPLTSYNFSESGAGPCSVSSCPRLSSLAASAKECSSWGGRQTHDSSSSHPQSPPGRAGPCTEDRSKFCI